MAMSPSPPPQQMTKRDKKRRNIVDKVNDMVASFSKDQTQHYRAQLQAIQVDMTLILRADPYENAPLDDDPQKIEDLVEALTGGNIPGGRAAREDFYALAGRRYYEYCQEINKAQEKRDADLTMLKNQFDTASAELDRLNAYKIQVAQREHAELSSTIRQRLINVITKKRDRLMREKEQLDIADSNSLLMHPGHYSMNVPASPGGLHSNRKTRNTRHRPGDLDDSVPERSRKRKLPGDDDGNESPLPGFRPMTQDGNGGLSPFQDLRNKVLRSQQEASAFAIDTIFTEKELAHATTAAQFATQHFFNQQMQLAEQNSNTALANGKAGSATDTADGTNASKAEDPDRPPSPGPPTEATGMERQISNYATRGAAKANPLSFLSDAAVLAGANGDATVNPYLPVMIPITKTDKGAPTPPSASVRDINYDLAMIVGGDADVAPPGRVARQVGEDGATADGDLTVGEARKSFLEQVCREPVVTQPFRLPLTDLGPAMIRDGVNRPATLGFADPASIPNGIRDGTASAAAAAAAGYSSLAAAGAFPMSRATSLGGSEMGASEVGAVGMRRTRSRAV